MSNFLSRLYFFKLEIWFKIRLLSKKCLCKLAFFNIDITNEIDVINTVAEINSMYGSIDVLFNNAASKGPSLEKFLAPFEDYEISTWNSVFNVNLTGIFLLSREVIKFMKKQKNGSIIQTASIYGVVAPKKDIY